MPTSVHLLSVVCVCVVWMDVHMFVFLRRKEDSQMSNDIRVLFICTIQLKPGQQIPSPSELLGKILIKNKKGSHEKPAQAKKPTPAATDQTTTTAASPQDPNSTSQDPANPAPSTQENQGGLDEPRAKSDNIRKKKKKRPLVIFRCRWHYVYMFNQRETQLWRTQRSRRTQRNRMRRKWRRQMR